MIHLPALFEEKLKQKSSLHADVRTTLNLFEPWLEQSGMPFFPGFTDHSPRHINEVLSTAASLISDASHHLLSPEDIAVLTIAILLHDCGMHLTQDGFRALAESRDRPPIEGLGDQPWAQLWKEFKAEASRFGEDKLQAVFGDTEPVQLDKLNLENLSERDCLLVGEFVRRHHARLAHEIALNGVPLRSGTGLKIVGLDNELCDLAGLVARSHGLHIRAAFPYVQRNYGRVEEYRNIKVPFLMAVLRIADYVQVQSERALKSLLSVKELRSPLSRQEWRNHFAVRDVTTRYDDPEAMYVYASPADVKTFLRLEFLFNDIQRELDESWATLGEVYGRFGDLAKLGLTIRRIRSNFDDLEEFSRTVPYVPIRAGFSSSGPELLKLLVGPLYDYRYGIGVRELLQNAVDACTERADLTGDALGEVLVEVEESDDGSGWVTVTDAGVGMTLSTVTKYFLVAGASFRNSELWKRQHTDERGKSRILRGGRFGVGALAAFLLGEQIQVRTRHFAHPDGEGLEFTARIDEPVVELRKSPLPAGTAIRVWVSDTRVMEALRPFHDGQVEGSTAKEEYVLEKWEAVDWFAQLVPAIRYSWSGPIKYRDASGQQRTCRAKAVFRPQKNLVPTHPGAGWLAVPDVEPYRQVLWRYEPEERVAHNDYTFLTRPPSQVVVNGIRVQTLGRDRQSVVRRTSHDTEGPSFDVERPTLSISDPAGVCPLNLQRSRVAFDRMGIDDKLVVEIVKEYVSSIRQAIPQRLSGRTFRDLCMRALGDRGVVFDSAKVAPLCALKSGVGCCRFHGHRPKLLELSRSLSD